MKVFQSWLGWYREWEKNRRGCYIRCHIYQWLGVIFMSLQSWNTKYARQHINTLSGICFLFFSPHAVGRTLAEKTFSSLTEVEQKIKLEKEQILLQSVKFSAACPFNFFILLLLIFYCFCHLFSDMMVCFILFTLPTRAVGSHDPLFYTVVVLPFFFSPIHGLILIASSHTLTIGECFMSKQQTKCTAAVF